MGTSKISVRPENAGLDRLLAAPITYPAGRDAKQERADYAWSQYVTAPFLRLMKRTLPSWEMTMAMTGPSALQRR